MYRLLTHIVAIVCALAMQGKTAVLDSGGKMSAELKRVLADSERMNQNGDSVRVMLWLDEEPAASELTQSGSRIVARCGSVCTLSVPAHSVRDVCGLPQVSLAEVPRRMHLHNDSARNLTRVDEILRGDGLTERYDGRAEKLCHRTRQGHREDCTCHSA